MLECMQPGAQEMAVWKRVGRGSSLVIWTDVSASSHRRSWLCWEEPGEGREEEMDWGFHLISCSQEHLILTRDGHRGKGKCFGKC